MHVDVPRQRAGECDAALLDGQRLVLELLAQGAALPQALGALCSAIERRIPRAICSVLLLDAEVGVLRHGAAPRLPAAYCAAIDGASIGPVAGSCGTAAFLRHSVIVEDIATDPLWAAYSELALPHSLCACASIPIFDPEGAVLGTFAIYHSRPGSFDASELEVLHDFSGLATVVIQTERRRLELAAAETVVSQAQKLESLGVLAGGIAHDFNNLLAIMTTNLSLAQRHIARDSEALTFVKATELAALRAADLTKQLLAYAGKGRFVVRPLDLSPSIEQMTQLLSVALPKKVTLEIALAPALPLIEGDAAQLQQVVMNLVTNAADSIADAEGTVRVTTAVIELGDAITLGPLLPQRLEPGRYVTLRVEDSGCGMRPEVMARIFDPFFTTKMTGRGLGLSAILGILRSHRAGLRLHSEPGKGSAFEIFFPALAGAGESPDAPAVSTLPPVQAGVALVVDDEPALREAAAHLFRAIGFGVVTAANGLEALACVAQRGAELSVVLMDLTMPKMGGAEAVVELRKLRPELPVILCSGYSEEAAIERTRSLERVQFLQKPYQLHELEQAVELALTRTR